MAKWRGKDDQWNSIISGAIAGGAWGGVAARKESWQGKYYVYDRNHSHSKAIGEVRCGICLVRNCHGLCYQFVSRESCLDSSLYTSFCDIQSFLTNIPNDRLVVRTNREHLLAI